MSDPITPTPEAPVAPVAAPVSALSTDTPLTPAIVVGLSPEQRKEALKSAFEPPKPVEKPVEVAPASDMTTTQVVEAEAAAAAEAKIEASDPDENLHDETKPFRVRISTKNAKHAAFIKAFQVALQSNADANPVDAARLVGYEMPAQEAAEYDEIPQLLAPVEHPDVTQAKATLTALDAQIEAIEDGTLVTKDVKALLKQRGDALAQLSEARLRAEFAAQREQDRQTNKLVTAKEQNKAEVLKEYPTANDDNSELGTEIVRMFAQVSNPSHPDHKRILSNDFPRWITEQAAAAAVKRITKNLGLTEAQALAAVKGQKAEATSPAVQPPKQAPTVPRTVLVTSPGGQSAPNAPTMTQEQAIELARSNPKLRRAALAMSNGVTIG